MIMKAIYVQNIRTTYLLPKVKEQINKYKKK